MRCAIGLMFAALVSVGPSVQAAPPEPRPVSGQRQAAAAPFRSPEQALATINAYRGKPEPQRMPGMLKALSAMGAFRDVDSAGVYVGFAAGVLADNPAKAEGLVTAMFPMAPEDQVVIIRAIAYSGLPDWKALLGKFVERMPARRVLIDRHMHDKVPGLMALPLDQSPAALDTLWGYYFATGREEPIRRIVSALPWSKEQNDVEKLTTGSMVKLTLAVNAARDPQLLRILQRESVRSDKTTSAILADIIEAAETYETARIKREALAAIDDIKRKGPGDKRTTMFWGQVGQTALAIGCVAAAVTGHIELGVPCVVSGALSSAALRFVAP